MFRFVAVCVDAGVAWPAMIIPSTAPRRSAAMPAQATAWPFAAAIPP